MERDPGEFEHHEEPPRNGGKDDIDVYLASLPPILGLPSTDEEIAAADARALEDIAAGRVYPHEIVGEWLKTWGSPDRKAFKDWLAARNG